MCGIAGILTSGSLDLRRHIVPMCNALRHRGPDDEGVLVADGSWAIGNCRLAIRDTSPAGHMPMCTPDGAIAITYNGEIYNADVLRNGLKDLGWTFRSHSDTEVILHGYSQWGPAIVEKLNGIFAFAIVDARRGDRHVLLARDHLGVKPLYYARTDTGLVFASEIRGIRASGLVARDLSTAGLVGYLLEGAVPAPFTMLREIRSLPAASTLTIGLDAPRSVPEPQRYWALPTTVNGDVSERTAVDTVRNLMQDAVASQLVSDVPLGVFLSGGLDSSAVASLMRRATAGQLRTCSVVFEEGHYSEAPYARAMADAVGAEHYERVVTADTVRSELDHVLWAMDQPTIDGVNTYFVAQTARQAGLTVALSGLGGDEVFGGYPGTFQGVPQLLRALRLVQKGNLTTPVEWILDLLPLHTRWRRVRDALRHSASPQEAYRARRGLFSVSEVRDLVGGEVWESGCAGLETAASHASMGAPGSDVPADGDLFNWISRAEMQGYMHNQLLRDTDAMSMAHSLEVRVPLLDRRLVETVLRLPGDLKVGGGHPKWLLSAAVADALPPAVTQRRDKRGFTFPFDVWLRGPLRPKTNELIDDAGTKPWVCRDSVQRVWRDFQNRKISWTRPWAIAVLAGASEHMA